MPNPNDKFDFSDVDSEMPATEESTPVPEDSESYEAREARLLKEGLPRVHAMFKERVDDEAAVFGAETTRVAESVEGRYEMQMNAPESENLQDFLEREEALRARTQAEIEDVVDGRYVPHDERRKQWSELRARRAQLDREWDELTLAVVAEGEDDSERMTAALETGEDVPVTTPAGKRLNEVWREILDIDRELEKAPAPRERHPEDRVQDPDDLPATERPIVPPPPGSELRAEWLRMRAKAETDPAKKQEWKMKYFEEVHGPSDKPAEARRISESLPDTEHDVIDYTTLDDVDAEIARKEAERKTQEAAEARVKRILSGEEIINWEDADGGAEDTEAVEIPKPSEKEEPQPKPDAPETPPKPSPEIEQVAKKPVPKPRTVTENPLDFLVTQGADDDVELPLPTDFDETPTAPSTDRTANESGTPTKDESAEKKRDRIIERFSISPLAMNLSEDATEANAKAWLSDYKAGKLDSKETLAVKIARGEAMKSHFADKASFVAYLKEEAKKDPKYNEIIDGIDAFTPDDMEGMLGGIRMALDNGMHIIREEITEEAEQEMPKEEAVAKTSTAPTGTHSERNDGNAEIIDGLVKNLELHISKLEERGTNLQTLNSPAQLLKAFNSAKILSREASTGILNDTVRKNVLMTAFKKAMKARNKKK